MKKGLLLPVLGFFLYFSFFGLFSVDTASAQTCTGSCITIGQSCSGTINTSLTCSGSTQVCCVATGSTPTPGAPTGSLTTVQISNPLSYNTVNGLLGRVLTFLQSFIVILSLIFIIIGAFMYITSGGESGRIETAKKCITAALIGLAIGIAAPAFLRQISEILGWTGADATPPAGVGTSLTLIEIATNVLNFLLSIVGVVALIMLVVGAFMYLTAAGEEDRIDTGKSIVKYSIIGIAIALAALVLVRQIASFF
ncbi:MAG: hypothetical protein WBB68_00500 [Candidatus Moraniibacteriota bacterium]